MENRLCKKWIQIKLNILYHTNATIACYIKMLSLHLRTTFFTCLYAPDSVFPWTLSTLYGGLIVTLSNTTIFAPFHVMSCIVFEIAIKSFCPSGDTPACRAITSLFFSSIWLRTRVFSLCKLRLCGGSFVVALTSRITWTLDTRDKFTTCTSFNEDLPLDDGHSKKLLLRKMLFHV